MHLRDNPLAARMTGQMIDHFATLQQPRRPWLDVAALKEEFHRRSASLHPDVPGTGDAAQFTALNAAYTVLREPGTRVRHLLELVAPATLAKSGAPLIELGDLFMLLAGLLRRLGDLLAQRAAATTPLSRALLAGSEMALRRELAGALTRLESANSDALDELQELDGVWKDLHPESIDSLARLSHRLAYLARWLAQTREALVVLEH